MKKIKNVVAPGKPFDPFFEMSPSMYAVQRAPLEPITDRLECAQDCQEWENQTALRALLSERDAQIRQAELRRKQHLEKICVDCTVEIDPERLRVMPNATRCVKCQAEYARRGQGLGCKTARCRSS